MASDPCTCFEQGQVRPVLSQYSIAHRIVGNVNRNPLPYAPFAPGPHIGWGEFNALERCRLGDTASNLMRNSV
jgi:hypothetical protein